MKKPDGVHKIVESACEIASMGIFPEIHKNEVAFGAWTFDEVKEKLERQINNIIQSGYPMLDFVPRDTLMLRGEFDLPPHLFAISFEGWEMERKASSATTSFLMTAEAARDLYNEIGRWLANMGYSLKVGTTYFGLAENFSLEE